MRLYVLVSTLNFSDLNLGLLRAKKISIRFQSKYTSILCAQEEPSLNIFFFVCPFPSNLYNIHLDRPQVSKHIIECDRWILFLLHFFTMDYGCSAKRCHLKNLHFSLDNALILRKIKYYNTTIYRLYIILFYISDFFIFSLLVCPKIWNWAIKKIYLEYFNLYILLKSF